MCDVSWDGRRQVSHNQLTELPESVGALTQLTRLDASHNLLARLPDGLGRCTALEDLDLRHNVVAALPESLGDLRALQALWLDTNRVRAVPPRILKGCVSLQTLSLHQNPLTVETLRETEGFAEYDQRRRTKYDKKLDFAVMSNGHDEGADHVLWERDW